MEELCEKFMRDYSSKCNKISTQTGYQNVISRNIIPLLGRKKVHEVKRTDIAGLMEKFSYKPAEANRTFGLLRKMFNMAEVWGYRPDGANPCRHVPMYPDGKVTRLINDEEMIRIFCHLAALEAEGLEHYTIPLAIRLQFEFATRISEIYNLELCSHRRQSGARSHRTGGEAATGDDRGITFYRDNGMNKNTLSLKDKKPVLPTGYARIHKGIVELLDSASHAAVHSVNALMTASYWEIGRRIVQAEQQGKRRTGYGEQLIERLSADLTTQFGRGFSRQNLQQMRLFFLIHPGYG